MPEARALILPNGLRVHCVTQPQGGRAAALLLADAGSHDEPAEWPGLAHLLEHLVFAGSESFREQARLMAWVQAQGGRVNATTLATSTAYFFEVNADQLEAGVARLVDMLAAPLLTQEAQRQECAIIDAEYGLLQTHAETQCAAALSLAFRGPTALHRFQVGSRESFGDDEDALQQALRAFHQRVYRAANLTLWLHGPQPLEILEQLARRYGGRFAAGELPRPTPPAPPELAAQPVIDLRCAGTPRLRLGFALSPVSWPALSLLRRLLVDEATGSLLAGLRQENLCDEARLLLEYRSATAAILSVEFSGSTLTRSALPRMAALFQRWCQRLTTLTPAQREHYAHLAEQKAGRLPPMDQLREQAFGFPPPGRVEEGEWRALLAQLTDRQGARLWAAPDNGRQQASVQGFPLTLSTRPPEPLPAVAIPDWHFHPLAQPSALPALPVNAAPLPQQAASGDPVLLLRPARGHTFPDGWGHAIQRALRPLAGDLAHQGGELAFGRQQGVWALRCRAQPSLMPQALAHICARLPLSAEAVARGQQAARQEQQAWHADIPIRTLLNRLPGCLATPMDSAFPGHWQASLYGGEEPLRLTLARQLSAFPAPVNAAAGIVPILPPARRIWPIATASAERALLLFCPLDDAPDAKVAGQLLAMIYEPRFFQRLRVELNIGYVVSCRFHQSADHAGILFALQSPHLTTRQLLRHCKTFLQTMTAEIAALHAAALAETQAALIDRLRQPADSLLDRAWDSWQHPAPAPALIAQCDPATLLMHHQRLCRQRTRWWILSNEWARDRALSPEAKTKKPA